MIEARQHALAVATISLVDVVMDAYSENLPKRLARIKEWSEKCATQTRGRSKVSRGAQRAWLMFSEAIDRRGLKKGMDENALDARWAALVWTVLIFVEDVRRVCPIYAEGPQARAWRYLEYHLSKIAAEQLASHQGADEIGTGIYEEAAWALEEIPFRAPQLEAA